MKCFRIFAGILGACIAITSLAQDENSEGGSTSKVYFKLYGGYGLFTPGAFKGVSNNDNNDVNVVKVQKVGMGGGLRVGAGFGIIVNEYINVGIDGEYLMGKTIKVKVGAVTGASITTQGTITYDHKVYFVIPNIVFKAISKPSYYIYNRIGLVVGIPSSVTEQEQSEYHFKNLTVGTKEVQQTDLHTTSNGIDKLKNSFGYQGVLGIQTKVSEKLRGFFEIAVYGISFDRISYEDIKRQVVQTDIKNDNPPTSKTTMDNSRYIRKYAESGWTNYEYPPGATGPPFNKLITATYPQSPVNMNTLTVGVGLAYRF